MVRGAPGAHPAVPTAFGYLPDIPVIREAARGSAYFDANSDPDAVIRSQMMVIRFNAHYYLPLSVAMVASLFPHPPLISLGLDSYGVAGVSISNEEIPVDDLGQMLINFRGPGNTFPRYSAVDIIEHRIPAAELAEKLVLVGVTARGLGDRVSTPFDEDSPGVEVHANVIDNLITGDFLHRLRLNELFARISACVIGLAVSLAVAFLTERQSAVAAALLAVGYLALAQLALAYLGLVLNVLLPLFTLGVTYTGLAGYRYATEGVEKRRLRLAFEHYLHPQVIESILDKPDTVKLGGELRYISILFADIINYTARAEREKPEDLVALLNAYLTTVTDLILRSGGVVDKIRGDGVMAFWGAPAEVPNPSRLAIDCALAMLEELKMLRDRDPRFADVDIGIGIATGEAVVGNFGGERRFDYSAIGDTVNLASRFESLTRQFKAHLLVTEAAFTEADGLYVAREVGLVKVKGRAQVVRMIEVIGGKIGGKDDGINVGFTQALMLVRGGQSHEARGALERLLKDKPSDQVVRMYLDRLCSVSDGSEHEVVFEFDSK
jgi:adenylate cyclase